MSAYSITELSKTLDQWQDYDQCDYLEQAKQDLEQLFILQQPNDNYPILK